MVALLEQALEEGESHTTEFKESIKLVREAAQAVVAFANAHGGDVFIGVTNARKVKGITPGDNTLEQLAADLDGYIYPYSPAAIDPIPVEDGKIVVRLSVVADKPPVVGVYLYSSGPLRFDERVPASRLTAFRRVGRTNRKVLDFMWLRGRIASDPFILIRHANRLAGERFPKEIGIHAWAPEGSGQASTILFRLEPPGMALPVTTAIDFLPGSDQRRIVTRNFSLTEPETLPEGVWVIAEYQDDWGCTWESRRYWQRQGTDLHPTATMSRRIVELPAKSGTA